jgi:hypothetical protein
VLNLKELLLDNNCLSLPADPDRENNIFTNLHQLSRLDLSGNNITKMNPNFLHGMPNLQLIIFPTSPGECGNTTFVSEGVSASEENTTFRSIPYPTDKETLRSIPYPTDEETLRSIPYPTDEETLRSIPYPTDEETLRSIPYPTDEETLRSIPYPMGEVDANTGKVEVQNGKNVPMEQSYTIYIYLGVGLIIIAIGVVLVVIIVRRGRRTGIYFPNIKKNAIFQRRERVISTC